MRWELSYRNASALGVCDTLTVFGWSRCARDPPPDRQGGAFYLSVHKDCVKCVTVTFPSTKLIALLRPLPAATWSGVVRRSGRSPSLLHGARGIADPLQRRLDLI